MLYDSEITIATIITVTYITYSYANNDVNVAHFVPAAAIVPTTKLALWISHRNAI